MVGLSSILNNLHYAYGHHHPVLRKRTLAFWDRTSPYPQAETKVSPTQLSPNKKATFSLRVYAQKLWLFATRDDGKCQYNE